MSGHDLRNLIPLLLVACTLTSARAAEPPAFTPEEIRFFESEVRPLLVQRCHECHGADQQKGGLRLDSRDGAILGGDSGPAIEPGDAAASLLVEAIRYESYEMPPDGQLPEDEAAALVKWIELGAPWPAGEVVAAARPESKITDEDRAHWAFQPLTHPTLPDVSDEGWSRNDIDRFLFAQMADAGLNPAPEAAKETLVRRLYLDVIGLPPTPEQVDAFLSDDSPQAVERLVEELLESPQYGEKWASFWLDLVRYADSDGYKQDDPRPHAWRYRDYVINAFNADKPYDQFVLEQLAGDEVAPHDPEALAATGYFRHGIYEYNQRDAMGQWRDMLNDITDNVGDTFLAMGMGCARCHDHKFDPILQKDYFRLQAFFVNLSFRDDVPLATPEQVAAYGEQHAAWHAAAADVLARMDEITGPKMKSAEKAAVGKFVEEIRAIWAKPPEERTPYEKQIADLIYRQVLGAETTSIRKLSKEEQAVWDELEAELAQFDPLKPAPLPPGQTVSDTGPTAPVVFIPGRERLGEVEPGYLTILDSEPAVVSGAPAAPESTGRRTAFAQWLIRPDHPLTSRVIVNRVWQQHFGTGLVATPSDFGHLGQPPSHPELLDWLAAEFVNHGWSLKWLHREILTSAAFQQSSVSPDAVTAERIDPANRLLWRFPVRRLTAEQIRDSMLAVSGALKLETGGAGVDGSKPRRSVYVKVERNSRDGVLDVFDLPDRIIGTGERTTTTTPTQSLLMINGGTVLKWSKDFAERVQKEVPGGADSQVRHAYRLAYGRDPTAEELDRATAFLAEEAGGGTLTDVCHVLFNSNEFLYVD